ncbi:Alpha/Beta hydrolase protein [Scleroderma yunnanense]
MMAFEYTNQPWKTLYLAYELFAILFILLPVWSVTYVFTRPRPTWSWTHAMIAAFLRRLDVITEVVEGAVLLRIPDYRAISPTAGYNAEAVWIEGMPRSLITTELAIFASVAHVAPIRILGYWYARDGTAPKPTAPVSKTDQKKVFLYLHGGGFTMLSAHPSDLVVGSLSRSLVELTVDVPHLLAVEYRLSSTHPLAERHPFPTALLDALAGYIHLIDVVGYDPSNIILAGDSAGGNLALALVRYLVENQGSLGTDTSPELPAPPGHLLLMYPWADMSNTHAETEMAIIPRGANRGLQGSAHTNDMDILGDFWVGKRYPSYNSLAYTGPFGLGIALNNRYFSPACLSPAVQAQFRGFPRTFIVVGDVDRLLDQVRTLRDMMARDMPGSGQVTYHEEKDGIHGFLTCPSHPGGRAALKAIGRWLVQD